MQQLLEKKKKIKPLNIHNLLLKCTEKKHMETSTSIFACVFLYTENASTQKLSKTNRKKTFHALITVKQVPALLYC